ncbi:MAG TPA: DNA topoisomerase IB [Methylophilus sp.]|nr:DNA topoisomerase IB [Methylophilus sp.]
MRGKFRYLDAQGQCLKCRQSLSRIAKLRIPPAWESVWICPHPQGHLQATGRDAKGRKQYLYHAAWRLQRENKKYAHMVAFGQQLPIIRQQVDRDLKTSGMGKQKVLAMMIRLLENTLIRIGNDAYARTNKSFGLTTLRNRHVAIENNDVEFHFRGKSGVEHRVQLHDPCLARMMRQLRELPGQALFQYVDSEGLQHAIGSTDVNDYLRQLSGDDYTAKDFRTWFGSLHTLVALSAFPPCHSEAEAKKNIVAAIRLAASRLGNTPAICRHSYVHPSIIDSYLAVCGCKWMPLMQATNNDWPALSMAEQSMLELLQQRT